MFPNPGNPFLPDETGFRLEGISRKNREEGAGTAKKHSLRYFPHWQELIADPAIQAVLIVTHPSLHLPMALEAIKAKKAILVEKPLALNGEQGRHMVQAAEEAHIPLMTAQTLRYDPTIQRLRQIASQMDDLEYLSCTMRLEPSTIPSPVDIEAWRANPPYQLNGCVRVSRVYTDGNSVANRVSKVRIYPLLIYTKLL